MDSTSAARLMTMAFNDRNRPQLSDPPDAKLQGIDRVLEADVARHSPDVRHHIRGHGHYTFTDPDLRRRTYRTLRDPDTADEQ